MIFSFRCLSVAFFLSAPSFRCPFYFRPSYRFPIRAELFLSVVYRLHPPIRAPFPESRLDPESQEPCSPPVCEGRETCSGDWVTCSELPVAHLPLTPCSTLPGCDHVRDASYPENAIAEDRKPSHGRGELDRSRVCQVSPRSQDNVQKTWPRPISHVIHQVVCSLPTLV